MIRLFRLRVPLALLVASIADLVLLALAGWVGMALRASQLGLDPFALAPKLTTIFLFVIANGLGLMAAGALSPESLRSRARASLGIQAGVSLGAVLLAILSLPGQSIGLSAMAVIYATILAFPLLLMGRLLLRPLGEWQGLRQRVLVLGAGARANQIARLVVERPGLVLAGRGALLGSVDLVDRVAAMGVDELVLALEERRNALPLAELIRLRTTGLRILDAASFVERETGRIDLRLTNPSWLILSDGFLSGRRLSAVAKRLFDLAAAGALLGLIWPLVVLAILAIRLEGPGPVFFRQHRVGLYGATFPLLKLRSMRPDAEADGQARWAELDDPRVTRVGRWLRQFRIDELPQLWNVLRGEMSFVGPRPERPTFVNALQARIPFYAERHMVKPGITGWAQIHYPYGASEADARAKLEYDLYYAKNYTFFLDVLILVQTVRVVLWPQGAR